MVVEDSPDVQRALLGLLSMIPDVRVVGVASGTQDANRLIDLDPPEVVVLDIALQGNDRGMDVLSHVIARYPLTQVIVLSNHAWPTMREGFLSAGAVACFDKGLQFRDACAWIQRRAAAGATPAAAPGAGP